MLVRRLLPLLLVSFIAVPHFAVQGQDKDKAVTLKWKFEKDKKFYQKMSTETKQTMKIASSDFNQTQNQTFVFEWTPTAIDGDTVTLTQEIKSVKMDINIGNQAISFDSNKEKQPNNPLNDFFNALKGSKFIVKLNTKDMKVTSIEGRQEFIEKLAKTNPQMKPLLDVILSEKALKDMAEPAFAPIPNKDVKKGDTWTRDISLDMGPIGKFDNSYKYTYDGPVEKEKQEKIKVESTLKYKEPGDVAGIAGLPFKIKSADLKSSQAGGNVYFDPQKGRIEKSEMSVELKGNLQIEIGGQTTPVELSQTQKSTVDTSDDNPNDKKQ